MPPRRKPQTESARAARRADRSLSIPELAQLSGAPVATVEGWRATYPAPPRDPALALEEQRAVLLQIAARLDYHPEPGEEPGEWLARVLPGFRQVRHPGNHVYVWRWSGKKPESLPYPRRP